jgi:putative DNA primase/helicase
LAEARNPPTTSSVVLFDRERSDNEQDRPQIRISGGSLSKSVDQAEQVLIDKECGLYQRGSMIVRPAMVKVAASDDRETIAQRLVPVTIPHLVDVLTREVDIRKYSYREKFWMPINCPKDVAASYLAREGLWKLPTLTAVINCPTLRPDGSILDQAGYDPKTGLLFDPQGITFPQVRPEPTKEHAAAALKVLNGLIATFPFLTDADRSVALSGILTTIIRRSLKTAPLHGFTAPVAASGKSKLVDICSEIATGHPAAVISQGKDEAEQEKRLGASLLAGDSLISIDNCEAPLGGEVLCQMLTQQLVKTRVLGQSLNVVAPTTIAMFATGNNLTVNGDMTRRALLCSLDPKCERPELREFKTDPHALIASHRGKYTVAALTVLRAYHVAGRPKPATPLGSFEEWSAWVRSALIWLGEADPVTTMEKVRASDPQLEQMTTVIQQWTSVLGQKVVTVKEVIETATRQGPASGLFVNSDFREALLVIAGDKGVVNSLRLASWLSRRKGRIVDGFRLIGEMGHEKTMTWQLLPVKQ